MTPIYQFPFVDGHPSFVEGLIEATPWLNRTEARQECFQSEGGGVSYTYGQGRGVRTYTSIPYTFAVETVLGHVNQVMDNMGWGPMNGCFLNHYLDKKHHLGWHADDFREMDHSCPVVVVSFGAEREIWWRPIGESGVVPADQRQLLQSGSLFIMPPGMQHTHEHRVPKADRVVGPRVSMTFRRFL